MRHVAPPIGVAETARGLLVSLPSRFWLLVSLRQHFQLLPVERWTYLLRGRDLGRRLENWIAAVEIQLAAESRRRAWSATDLEWDGIAAPPPARPAVAIEGEAFTAAIAAAAKPGIARPTMRLLEAMRAGDVLVITETAEGRAYRLSESGRSISAGLAERAIGAGLLVPSCDGLFGPEWSQTWRAPPAAEVPDAAENGGGARRAARDPAGKIHRSGAVQRARTRRPDRRAGQGAPREALADGSGRAAPRRRRGVA